MGLLDRLRDLVSGGDAASAGLRGPLDLGPGDGVGYYRERFAVAAVRRLSHGDRRVWHYCVRDRDGGSAVLALEEGPGASLWLQRPLQCEIAWDGDVVESVPGGPFRLARQGQASTAQTGDTDTARARAVHLREYADPEGERLLVLEDWAGHREARLGEQVHEAELTILRAAGDAPCADAIDGAADEHSARGSPGAAAAALGGEISDELGDFGGQAVADAVVRDDVDPTAFDDESWDDEDVPELADEPAAVRSAEAVADTEEDEWREASRWIRENGVPPELRRR
jgi:hypothetical protein